MLVEQQQLEELQQDGRGRGPGSAPQASAQSAAAALLRRVPHLLRWPTGYIICTLTVNRKAIDNNLYRHIFHECSSTISRSVML